MLIEDYRADGSLTLKQTVDAGGVKTLDQYDSLGHVVQQTVTQKDGSFLQSSYAPDGSLIADTARHADGTRNVDTYDVTGQAYSARHDVMNASGHRVSTTFDNNDGSHTMAAYASGVTLTSTATNDVMNSAGGDSFVFKQASGQDIINNFRPGDFRGPRRHSRSLRRSPSTSPISRSMSSVTIQSSTLATTRPSRWPA